MAQKLLERSQKVAKGVFDGIGAAPFLRLPSPTNPTNTVASMLNAMHCGEWVDNWIEAGRKEGYCQLCNSEAAMDNPLSKMGPASCHFTFTYDQDVEWEPANS